MGYGAGGHNRKRVTVEACARLDVAMLKRAGLFDSAGLGMHYWSYTNNQQSGCIIMAFAVAPNVVTLAIVPKGQEPPIKDGVLDVTKLTHLQRVRVSHTDCNYGKSRAWLHCPTCGRRVFRLFYYDHTFSGDTQVHYLACRHCYGLTYQQRRSRGFDRYQDRAAKIKSKLIRRGAREIEGMPWYIPPNKPKGMHWRTYEGLMKKFERASEQADEMFCIALASHLRSRSF